MPDQLRYYGGTILHTPLAFLEILFGIEDKKNIFLFKHYVYFTIYFLSLFVFLIFLKRYKDWKYGILGLFYFFKSKDFRK